MKSSDPLIESNRPEEEQEPISKGGGRGTAVVFRLKTRLANKNYVKAIYSAKPEAVAKVISYARGFRVKKMMDYVARTEENEKLPVEVENDMGAALKGVDDIKNAFEKWKDDFERAKPGTKRKPRHAVHLMLSGACDNSDKNALKVLAAAREVIQEKIGQGGYEYVSALHRDSGNAHVHFIIKCKNREPGKPKLRINPNEILQIRTAFAEKMTALGLDHVATLRRDRPNIVERVQKGVELLKRQETQYQRAMKRVSPTINAFEHRKALSSTIIRLREQVKKETEPKSEKRRELLGALRSLERKAKKSRHSIEADIAATINKFEKESVRYQNNVIKLKSPEPNKKPTITRKQIKEMGQKIEQSIQEARKAIKAADTSPQEKEDALFMLKRHEQVIKSSMGRAKAVESLQPAVIEKLTALDKQVAEYKKLNKSAPDSATERLRRNRQLEKLSTEIGKGIDQTRKSIKKSAAAPADMKDALGQIRRHEQAIKPGHGRKREL